MILIADGGSTKIEWSMIVNRTVVKRMTTRGLNPVLLTREEIIERLNIDVSETLAPWLPNLHHVYYYGAGCLPGEVSQTMADALRHILGDGPKITIHNDLLSAARAACGSEPGIACILGTGSNSCYYDGHGIVDNVSPLGYILGDEGSGAVMGRRLVGDVLKRQLPADICHSFLQTYDLDQAKIIKRVYRDPSPNSFLASLAPFLKNNIHRPEIRSLVKYQLEQFFIRNLDNYRRYGPLPLCFVGSIAWHFRDILQEIADERGYTIGRVIQSPMEGLIQYHIHR